MYGDLPVQIKISWQKIQVHQSCYIHYLNRPFHGRASRDISGEPTNNLNVCRL